jgi:hypothetical protein
VSPLEKIADGATAAAVEAPPPAMLEAIVREMAALTQSGEIARAGVAGVVVEMRRPQHETPAAGRRELDDVGPGGGAAGVVTPALSHGIVPAPVGELQEHDQMRPPAPLAAAAGPLEADAPTDQRPIYRIEPAQLPADRHAFTAPPPVVHAGTPPSYRGLPGRRQVRARDGRRSAPDRSAGAATSAGRTLGAVLVLALLAACADAWVRRPDRSEARTARQLLEAQLAEQPLPIRVVQPPPGLTSGEVRDLAVRGVRGLTVRHVPLSGQGEGPPPAGGRYLVLWFEGPLTADRACGRAPVEPAERSGPPRLLAVYCDGATSIASASGEAGGPGRYATERLIWQTTGNLFPDDYAETYGFDLFGYRIRFGASAGL